MDQLLSKINNTGKRKHRSVGKETQFTLFVENMILSSVLLELVRIQLALYIDNNYHNSVAFVCLSNKM